MNDIIKIDHLCKNFGDVKAVQDLCFRVKEGELFAFLGVNGAGKSTTINIMCGQLSKDSGSVIIDDADLDKNLNHIKGTLGVVFQNSVLDSALSVYDNLQSRAALYGITGAAFKERLSDLTKLLDFENLLKRTVGKLSGGQRRRIDIARALINRPKILILDDSTSAVDTKTDAMIRKGFKEFIPDTTKIIIAQRIASIKGADRIAVLDNGSISAIGTHEELMAKQGTYRHIYDMQMTLTEEGEADE
mgnify:CR=1 FL=1